MDEFEELWRGEKIKLEKELEEIFPKEKDERKTEIKKEDKQNEN